MALPMSHGGEFFFFFFATFASPRKPLCSLAITVRIGVIVRECKTSTALGLLRCKLVELHRFSRSFPIWRTCRRNSANMEFRGGLLDNANRREGSVESHILRFHTHEDNNFRYSDSSSLTVVSSVYYLFLFSHERRLLKVFLK